MEVDDSLLVLSRKKKDEDAAGMVGHRHAR